MPAHAWIDDFETLWSALDVGDAVFRYREFLEQAREKAPGVVEWVVGGKPHRALAVEHVWGELLDTVCWIDEHAGPDAHLRQIDVSGVDTKFVESNRSTLAALLDLQLDAGRIDDTHPASEFEQRYRFRRKPSYVRYRTLDRGRAEAVARWSPAIRHSDWAVPARAESPSQTPERLSSPQVCESLG